MKSKVFIPQNVSFNDTADRAMLEGALAECRDMDPFFSGKRKSRAGYKRVFTGRNRGNASAVFGTTVSCVIP